MALFKRLSDGLWSYLSPRKPDAKQLATPQTAPPAKKRGRPPGPRKPSLDDVVKRTKSMSPVERVDSWRAQSVSSGSTRKRKTPMTPSTSTGLQRKIQRLSSQVSDYDSDHDEANPGAEEYDSEGESDLGSDDSGANNNVAARSTTPADHESYYDDIVEGDASLLVSDRDFESPGRKKIISPTKEAFDRGVSEQELREQGWDDDHIYLVQKIAMRGYEPLLPNHYKLEWPFMPDGLFADDDDAILTSVRGQFFRGSKALERLYELGGRIRDRVLLDGKVTPEQETKKMVKEYTKWAQADGNLDQRTGIPLLVVETAPPTVAAAVLEERARTKLEALAARYKAAFRVNESIESPSASHSSTVLSQPVPPLYAIIASGTLVALVAYNPAEEDSKIKPTAFFQMGDRDYDVWNALALAITICHLRNVQMRIAEETGLGLKPANAAKEEIDDPDL